ncbi:NAD-dependent epimerase/dehydratase family protein [Leucobacter albus]|uniref:NAD-dependent epimerase/dehydratase family protein n=1 Tax=Leucobacter albus TaxID=272210 RepID=A0ABW3TNV6_9MICO
MRALVLGGTGAVGNATVAALRARGHDALRGSRRPPAGAEHMQLDLATAEGLGRLIEAAKTCDVVINASGSEDPRIASELARAPYVDTSASTAYLARLRALPGDATRVVGAGIAPGVSTVLAAAVDPRAGDDIDIQVLLGTGEVHGPAAVAWTAQLAGRAIHGAPEDPPLLNYRERRRMSVDGRSRLHLRTDFPDHLLLDATGAQIRTYLTLGSPVATAGLALVGLLPGLRGMLAAAPHWGDERWRVAVTNRRTGQTLAAGGLGQSRATGEFAALAAIRAAEQPGLGAVTMADLFGLEVLEQAGSVATR